MKKKKNWMIILVAACILLSSIIVYANDFKCYTMVQYGDEIVQINPKQSEIMQVGIIDYFEPQPSDSKYQYVKVYFTKTDLRDNELVNFSVVCSGENQTMSFEREVTPRYKEAYEVLDRANWFKDNLSYLVVAAFVVLLIIILIVGAWRSAI